MKKIIERYDISDQAQIYIIFVFFVLVVSSLFYLNYQRTTEIVALRNDLASTTADFNLKLATLQASLATTTSELASKVTDQLDKNAFFEKKIIGISLTVDTLDKLTKTDRELLQKYSKVYFLNENYIPMRLSEIDNKYVQSPEKTLKFHSLVLPYLTKMLADEENTYAASTSALKVVSAYRSFDEQAGIKSAYSQLYGTGANAFSADQGYSEHQLGTTVDLTVPDLTPSLSKSFDNTPAYVWLINNAYRYGFIMSYPKGNTYYQYEPWHWRFVGIKLATYLHDQNKNFYDLDQRTIDTYLVNIFDL